jgi:putative MATE family efflux protein
MHDLTQGSITRHLLKLAGFMMFTMIFQTLYLLADLYWVGRLGKEAIAAVSVCGNLMMVTIAVTQALSVGTTTLISHAAGRKEGEGVQHVFNQSITLSVLTGVAFLALGLGSAHLYSVSFSADASTAELATKYLAWFIPALAMQFLIAGMAASLRGIGDLKPTMMIQIATVILNAALAPFLIFGWVTHHAMGITGAAVATFISVLAAVVMFFLYFTRPDRYLKFRPAEWSKPDFTTWRQMVKIGVPAGGEFLLISVYMGVIYFITRPFGAAAQAGFGIGGRVMQSLFLPIIAISFSLAPIIGQNFGAKNPERVKAAFKDAALIISAVMLLLTILCHISPHSLLTPFSKDEAVLGPGVQFLSIISLNFVAQGLIFAASSTFQGLGNTLPPLFSSSLRLILFAIPAYVWSRTPGFKIEYVWYLSVASVTIQMCVNLMLLRREFRRKLQFAMPGATTATA